MEKLIRSIFVPECLGCRDLGNYFCSICAAGAKITQVNNCFFCHKPSKLGFTCSTCQHKTSTTQMFFIYEYEEKVRECIRGSKYRRKEFAALKDLCKFTFSKLKALPKLYKDFVILPIPVSKSKLYQRKFNQAELIARSLCYYAKSAFSDNTLLRKKETKSQYTQTRADRFLNLTNAFAVNPRSKVLGKRFVIVDDICTTGATLLEAVKVLYIAGAKEVRCFALSRKS